jgi:protein-S-isoprenylcysteine O-methyltransferase Ste14
LLPPVYFLAAIILMVLLHWLVPIARWDLPVGRAAGAVLIVAGLGLTIYSARLFRRHGTAIKPFEQSRALVAEGPYRFTRNPMYVGLIVVLTGLALVLQSVAPLVVPPLFVGVLTAGFVLHEERMLEERFGDAYLRYRKNVRRWL